MTQLVPFVVFGVGLDDTFIIVGGFSRTNRQKSIEDRMIDTMEDVGLSITVTTVTTAFAFGLGSLSSIPAVRWLCLYSMVTIVIDFIYQVTFFVALLVLDERRIQQNRRDVCVCVTATTDDDNNESRPAPHTGEQPPNCIDLFMVWYSKQLLRPGVKLAVMLGFASLLAGCAYSTSQLTQEFRISELVPDGSYVTSFFDAFQDYSSRSLPMFAYFRFVDQSDSEIHEQMISYVDELAGLEQFAGDVTFCWIKDFKELLESDQGAFLQNMTFLEQVDLLLKNDEIQEVYGENIVRDQVTGEILASRCILYADELDLNVVSQQIDLLLDQREVTAAQPVNQDRKDWAFFTYDDLYLTWEFYNAIVGEWIFTTITGVVAVTAIGFICIPHWTAVMFVFPLIAILYIDLIGT